MKLSIDLVGSSSGLLRSKILYVFICVKYQKGTTTKMHRTQACENNRGLLDHLSQHE